MPKSNSPKPSSGQPTILKLYAITLIDDAGCAVQEIVEAHNFRAAYGQLELWRGKVCVLLLAPGRWWSCRQISTAAPTHLTEAPAA